MDFEHGKAVVLRFNDCINARDIEGLSRAMTDDHVFIDAADNRISGKPDCLRAWQGFFAAFPDYRNHLTQFVAREGLVVVIGRSSCSDRRLDGPALWTARVRGDRVSEWRVLEDNASNRHSLGLRD
jgi:ketosteroid isomerase-like protein